ncbi:mechanosensitive ion channel family protein [Neolewinella aurantiaca]|uniref:Mechanosensitive ion channel family protein n=1 Tax=Neolewinella aurantiaca TaxID=2602767 RepID=A0A5C7FUS3_9BACT|nr:mechanosensitive ion channel family protein [Neolewinella aurantiaca]TXF88584.1 mechanosensitive ion channel family protein [Neolewinella aurantiaca]
MLLFEIFGITFDLDPLFLEIKSWWTSFLKLLPNMLLAIIIALIGWVVTRFLKKYFDKLSRKLVRDGKIANLISTLLTILVVAMFGLLVLSVLQLDGAVNKIVAGAGVVGLAVGLAFQDPILNFFSGVILTVRSLFRVGDLIEVDGHLGKVREITLRHTALETLQGQEVMIPNKIVAQSPLKNYDLLKKRRVDIACGVSYGDDLAKVKDVTIKAIKDNVAHDEAKDVQLFFNEFGGSSVNYTLRFWLDQRKTGQADFLAAQSDAIMAIMTAYNDNDIMIPFPIRTLDFGIKGGEKLSGMLKGINEKNIQKKSSKSNGSEHAINASRSNK